MRKLPKKHFEKGEEYVKQFVALLKKLDLRLYEEIEKNSLRNELELISMKWFLGGFLSEYNID